jgi:tetraacyldisaccharide-1-P 4'-kinase
MRFFFQILDENKINLKDKIAFPDHYNFSRLEIQKMINFSQKKKYGTYYNRKRLLSN